MKYSLTLREILRPKPKQFPFPFDLICSEYLDTCYKFAASAFGKLLVVTSNSISLY